MTRFTRGFKDHMERQRDFENEFDDRCVDLNEEEKERAAFTNKYKARKRHFKRNRNLPVTENKWDTFIDLPVEEARSRLLIAGYVDKPMRGLKDGDVHMHHPEHSYSVHIWPAREDADLRPVVGKSRYSLHGIH